MFVFLLYKVMVNSNNHVWLMKGDCVAAVSAPIVSGGCGGTLTPSSSPGAFTSPGYPRDYSDQLNCTWTITVQQGERLRLHFVDVDLEHLCFDTIFVYEGEAMLIFLGSGNVNLDNFIQFAGKA